MARESREGDEGLDTGRNEGEDNVRVVEGRDGSRKNGSNVDALDFGRCVLYLGVRGRRVVDLTDRGEDAGSRAINVDEADRDDFADREQPREIGGETLAIRLSKGVRVILGRDEAK